MKDLKLKLSVLIVFSVFSTTVFAHRFPCGVRLWRFRNDKEPAEYGIYAGEYAPKKAAYVGLAVDSFVLISGRIQTCPPGFEFSCLTDAGRTKFVNTSNTEVYYVGYSSNHNYAWVDSKDGEKVPFAIDFGTHLHGVPNYFGRVRVNGFWRFGPVSSIHGCLVYPGDKGVYSKAAQYQVLTCRSRKCNETTKWPKMPVQGEVPEPVGGCTHTWTPYNKESTINAVSAGEHECGNTAYVGKAASADYYFPGRIQTVGNQGIYLSRNGMPAYMPNGSFYLVDDPKNSYYWVNFEGTSPKNAVQVRTTGKPFYMNIGRVKINGRTRMGYVIDPTVSITNANGPDDTRTNFEILVCDPWPKYQCGQEWKKYNLDAAPATDGFRVGSYKDGVVSYIGRGTSKYTHGCNYDIGRIQIAPANASGLYYLDEWTAFEKFDNITAEYLVQNPAYTYKWAASNDGFKVPNALELKKEGYAPFYIGMTKINDNVFVGKVKPGEGLFFVDIDGSLKSTSAYNVLTCTQPDASAGLAKETSDADWFGSFGCPSKKNFDFSEWRCVCKDEFRSVFSAPGAKWDEDSCSYTI